MASKLILAFLSLRYVTLAAAIPVVDLSPRQGNNPFINHCEQGCTTCHGAIRTVELSNDNSQCTSFNSQDTFPASYQNENGGWNVFFDTNGAVGGFVTDIIIRSPAGTDIDGCGVPNRIITTNGCYQNTLTSTFLLQYCQGAACDTINPSAAEWELADRLRAESPTGEPNITAWNIGVAEIRKRDLEARQLKETLSKRDCSGISANGGTYTKLADFSVKASQTQNCAAGGGATCSIEVGQEASVSYTLSVSLSAGIEGLFQASLGFELTNTQSSSISVTFQQGGGTTGFVAWTPIYECQDATLSGCSGDVSDGPVSGCRAKTINQGGQSFIDGVYSFVATA